MEQPKMKTIAKQNDLIRRKDVMAALEKVFDEYGVSWGEHYGGFASAVPNAIENIPIGYDIDKVAEQLKEESWGVDNQQVVDLNDAIEIVKGGAI